MIFKKLNRYIRLYNTIKFLKLKQIKYRLYYLLRTKIRKVIGFTLVLSKKSKSVSLNLKESIHVIDTYKGSNEFIFLNLAKKFDKIDWNYSTYGKLWTYNLTYFDFLSQKDNINKREQIESFIDNLENIKDGLEPFPLSLRGGNWVKYLSFQNIKNQNIDDSLYAQYYILLDNLEYHLLGNHLLENAFSLLFGAYYFQDEVLYQKSKQILLEQLEEQILADGGHFELSPMYHKIMLFRLLDSINLIQNNSWKDREMLVFLEKKAGLMLGWLQEISYENGDIPCLNDSSNDIAPKVEQLIVYSKRLGLNIKKIELKESGYRKILNKNYECIVDVGHIGAEYISGHAHSDTFNFELRLHHKPFIVDTGLSTYETCERRDMERSTSSHNTVEVNGQNQSDVWGGFRVANRANIVNLIEKNNIIEATHNGYNPILHTRKWMFEKDRIIIEDKLTEDSIGVVRLHFHPDIEEKNIFYRVETKSLKWKIKDYFYALGFNNLVKSKVLEIEFEKNIKINIRL